MKFLRWMGRSVSNFFAGLAALSMMAVGVGWATNYTLTQGAGTTFGSLVVAGVNYAQHLTCDPTTPANCGSIGTYGTAPGSVNAQNVNAFVTNASPNGAHNIANSPTINIASDQIGTAGTAASPVLSVQGIASMTPILVTPSASPDPCLSSAKTDVAIATSSGTVQLVAPSGSTQVYVCSFSLIAAATAVVNLVGGTGATCTTGTPVAALGSTTAASGMSLAANGGLTFGNGGATVVRTTTAGHGLCLIQSGTTALAGNITYVQQ